MKPVGLVLLVATVLFPAIQLFALPDVSDRVALFSQYLGLAALILMAWGQIMATRDPMDARGTAACSVSSSFGL